MIEANTRVLVVSNEALSQGTSNGRTLSNLLLDVPAQNIAQFYLHGTPDKSICANHYRVSDKDALNAFMFRKIAKKADVKNVQSDASIRKDSGIKRNCRNLVFRDIIWRSYRWWTKEFTSFIKEFNPSVLLFQAGDMPFMFLIAMKIAKKYKLPIVMYNSEGYVLKQRLYNGVSSKDVWHKILQKQLHIAYKKMMKTVNFCVYITEYLESCYQEKYPHPNKSCALYTPSEMKILSDNSQDNKFNLLYCGNLGVGRAPVLNDIAKILKKVNPQATLDIYGKFTDKQSQKLVCGNENVQYGGVVPYSQIPKLMSEAAMVLHCENPERLQNLKHAFSTKIADCLACGRPFLVYALREYPFVDYLDKNCAAHIAQTPDELEKLLDKCIKDKDFRCKYVQNGRELAQMNHDINKNAKRMVDIINSL